jgi:26S proteasome regulatory subunit N1
MTSSSTANPAPTLPTNPLSPDDQLLHSQLADLVTALHDKKELHQHALQMIKSLIKNATASLTSVPKPLKFLRERYDELKEMFEKWSEGAEKVAMTDNQQQSKSNTHLRKKLKVDHDIAAKLFFVYKS